MQVSTYCCLVAPNSCRYITQTHTHTHVRSKPIEFTIFDQTILHIQMSHSNTYAKNKTYQYPYLIYGMCFSVSCVCLYLNECKNYELTLETPCVCVCV